MLTVRFGNVIAISRFNQKRGAEWRKSTPLSCVNVFSGSLTKSESQFIFRILNASDPETGLLNGQASRN